MSRKCRRLAVAMSAQSLILAPLVPVPHERRSHTASLTASSARITVPAGVVMLKSQGMMPAYASPAPSHAWRSLPLRVYASSNAAHRTGSPAVSSRLTCAIASSGFVAIVRSSGIPAARRRSMSAAHRSGMYASKSAQACPDVVT